MKRFAARIGRFFWSWRFLKIVLWTATIIVLFYAEENWRGARAWAATKKKWEARGEVLDWRKFTPPLVPDAQNLGAIPFFRANTYGSNYQAPRPETLLKATRGTPHASDFPLTTKWLAGKTDDPVVVRQIVARQYVEKFKRLPVSSDPLVQMDSLYPFLAEVREAAATRPYCRFDFNTVVALPAARDMELITCQRQMANLFSNHALLALDEQRTDLALRDLETIGKLCEGVAEDPSLVGALVNSDMFESANGVVYDGLVRHAWNAGQLVRIERLAKSFDFLANAGSAMRGDAAATIANLDYLDSAKQRRTLFFLSSLGVWQAGEQNFAAVLSSGIFRGLAIVPGAARLWPRGWTDLNKCSAVDASLRMAEAIDLRARRVQTSMVDDQEKADLDAISSPVGLALWNVAYGPPYRRHDAECIRQLARQQAYADEASVACMLESYRLAHGTYPGTLDALAPASIDSIPKDVMSGRPFLYRLRPDGSFLLYSVGWLQKDEGGKITLSGEGGIDSQKSNWTWPSTKP